MNKLTFEEIKAIIESALFDDYANGPDVYFSDEIYDVSSIEHFKVSDAKSDDIEFVEKIKELGRVKIVASYGGEGRGDDYWRVYYFVDHDVYIKFDGWYRSYEGPEYEEMFEVKPVEVTKTVYQRVKND